jgi:putative transcriptional regulator
MAIRFRLRELIRERGMVERHVMKRSGVREGTFYQICNNEIKRLSVDVIDGICDALQCQPGDWIVWERERND